MARIFEPETKERKTNDKAAMQMIQAKMANEDYQRCQEGMEVNDGKYITYINDREDQ